MPVPSRLLIHVPFPSPESRKLWRALRSAHKMATSRCLWHESHCQENLLLVLGVDATQVR